MGAPPPAQKISVREILKPCSLSLPSQILLGDTMPLVTPHLTLETGMQLCKGPGREQGHACKDPGTGDMAGRAKTGQSLAVIGAGRRPVWLQQMWRQMWRQEVRGRAQRASWASERTGLLSEGGWSLGGLWAEGERVDSVVTGSR